MDYGCFTTMRVDRHDGPASEGIGVRGWELHVERLQRATNVLFGRDVSRAAIVEALATTTAGAELPILARLAIESDDLAITTSTRAVTPSSVPLRVRSVRHDRIRPELKHTLTAPELAERDAAVEAGFDDALFVTADGLFSEGSTWALVLGRPDGTWVTPAAPVLPSVTVALVAATVPIVVAPVGPADLAGFDRAAALGSGRGVHAIASIDAWRASSSVEQLLTAYDGVALDSPC